MILYIYIISQDLKTTFTAEGPHNFIIDQVCQTAFFPDQTHSWRRASIISVVYKNIFLLSSFIKLCDVCL